MPLNSKHINTHGFSLCGSETAEIAAVFETATQPRQLQVHHDSLEEVVSSMFEVAIGDILPCRTDALRIFTLDWKGLQMVLVVASSGSSSSSNSSQDLGLAGSGSGAGRHDGNVSNPPTSPSFPHPLDPRSLRCISDSGHDDDQNDIPDVEIPRRKRSFRQASSSHGSSQEGKGSDREPSHDSSVHLKASFMTVVSSDMSRTGEDMTRKEHFAATLLQSHCEERWRSNMIHLALRLRGGESSYVGQPAKVFLHKNLRHGNQEVDTSNGNLIRSHSGLKDAIVARASDNSITKKFLTTPLRELGCIHTKRCNHAKPQGLCNDLSVTIGRMFNHTTYEVEGDGSFKISTRSQSRNDPKEVEFHADVAGELGPGAQVGCGLSHIFTRRPYLRQRVATAHNRIQEDIKEVGAVRRWFLSSLIKGNILVDKDSTADAFIPSTVKRVAGHGVLLLRPYTAWYFSDLGGQIVSIGDWILFRSHLLGEPRLVVSFQKGCLTLGAEYWDGQIRGLQVESATAYYWSSDGITVGTKPERPRNNALLCALGL